MRSRLAEGDATLEQTCTQVAPISETPTQGAAPYFIQAVTLGKTAFLTTNLAHANLAQDGAATVSHLASELGDDEIAASWLIGRSRHCSIIVLDSSVSRCHAVIGHHPQQGFYIMDVGSSNGTFLNQQRLPVLARRAVQDGDLIGLSHLQIECFVITANQETFYQSAITQISEG
ncbi:FHA domain-containing protein [Myxacorys almedinensis A]|uniref:FHA domain-containing protein n=2 Tax=Myxacorys TaxID=2056239 RepID=A0A8J7Z7S6_9CYAN|nr:FHA domain-containing protein [Myxacorys almedinensis A]